MSEKSDEKKRKLATAIVGLFSLEKRRLKKTKENSVAFLEKLV